jgi:hypothetical protein
MFAPAAAMREVPFDPSLDYLFQGEEALYRYDRKQLVRQPGKQLWYNLL